MELHTSLQRMSYSGVLDAIRVEKYGALPEPTNIKRPHVAHQFQATFDLEWVLYRFVENHLEGELHETEKVLGREKALRPWSDVTVTGNVEKAWATTGMDYMASRWAIDCCRLHDVFHLQEPRD